MASFPSQQKWSWLCKSVAQIVTGFTFPHLHWEETHHDQTLRFLRHILRLLLIIVPAIGLILLVTKPDGWQNGMIGVTVASILYLLNLWWLSRFPSTRWGTINLVFSAIIAIWLTILSYQEYSVPSLLWLAILSWFTIMVAGYKSGLLITLLTVLMFLLYHFNATPLFRQVDASATRYIIVPAGSFMFSFVIFLGCSSLILALLDFSRRRSARELMASEQKRRLYIQQTSMAVIDCDVNGLITGWNRAAHRTFGYTTAEALGQHAIELLTAPDARPAVHTLVTEIKQQILTEVRNINTNYTKDGRIITCEWTNTGIWTETGQFMGFIYSAVDITARIESERELKLAKEQAEAATHAKSSFLANMSHEIRTPMNGVIGMTNLLLATALSAEQAEYVETIHKSGNALLDIINEILDFSKIESGKLTLDLQAFDLHRTLEDTINLLVNHERCHTVALTLQIGATVPHWLVGDAGRLRQILINLLGNALKFTERGTVTLAVDVQQLSGDWAELCFAVHDTGIGIAPTRINGLFERFVQADVSATRKYSGTGLGLSICKLLVDKMDGRIWAESELDKGSAFYVTLRFPLAEHRAPPLRKQLNPATLPKPALHDALTILLVEDNPINQKVALRILAHIGYQATLAHNGKAAVEAVQQHAYDLVLMDLQMPEMDGFEATRQIRRTVPRQRQPHIIAMTAAALAEDHRQALAAGMDDFIAKPIRPDALAQKLTSVPRLQSQVRQPIMLYKARPAYSSGLNQRVAPSPAAAHPSTPPLSERT